jgi:hypothetical protein
MPDQGVFADLPNGDVTETGIMYNPKTDKYQNYVEVWRRLPAEPGQAYCVLERIDGDGTARAFLGRVGSQSLGLEKSSHGVFSAWREETTAKGVRKVYEKGDTSRLPSLSTIGPAGYRSGETITLGGELWRVHTAGVL